MVNKLLFLLTLNFFLLMQVAAQKEIIGMGVRSTVQEVKNGRKHFVHTVNPKETLYSISKTYHIPIQDIAAVNNDLLLNLKAGQKVYIPVRPLSPEDEGAQYFFFFVAEKNMSLYQAAKYYKFDIEDFLKINPKAKTGIKQGEVIRVPKERAVVADEWQKDSNLVVHPIEPVVDKSCESFVYNKAVHNFKLSMLLPLYLQANEAALSAYGDNLVDAKFNRNTSRFMEYMQGVLLALNELRKEGINIDLQVYDTENNARRVKRLLSMGVVDDVDLIVGPVYSKHFLTVSDYLKDKEINIVSPLSRNTRLVANNSNAFLLTPSDKTVYQGMAYYLAKRGVGNIILLHNGTKKEVELAGIYKEQFQLAAQENKLALAPNFKMINYKLGGLSALRSELDASGQNIVIVPSSSEVFVTDIVAKINTLSLRYKIDLVGDAVWNNFENLSLSNLHNLNFQYATTSYVNYDDERTKNFVEEFRYLFRAEPTRFAFMGHDAMLYFGQVLKKYGKNFNYCISRRDLSPNRVALSTEWNLSKLDEYSGYENKTVFIMRYENGTGLSVLRATPDAQGFYKEDLLIDERNLTETDK